MVPIDSSGRQTKFSFVISITSGARAYARWYELIHSIKNLKWLDTRKVHSLSSSASGSLENSYHCAYAHGPEVMDITNESLLSLPEEIKGTIDIPDRREVMHLVPSRKQAMLPTRNPMDQ